MIKIAIIGCGYWGKNLIRNIHQLGNLACVCDNNSTLAQQFSTQYNVPNKSVENILSDPQINGVMIATPAITHAHLATQTLENNKHVFVEKPLALELEHATALEILAKKKKRILMVGHLMQYHPAFLAIKQKIQNGDIGKLQYIYSTRLNLGKLRREENILWSFAPHDISMILSLVNHPPKNVLARGASYIHESIEDETTTHLNFKGGVQAHIFVSWLYPFKEQKLVVVGDSGMLMLDDTKPWEEKLSLYPHQTQHHGDTLSPIKGEKTPIPLTPKEPLAEECIHFIDCIKNKQTPKTDAIEGIEVLKVLQASQQSMKQGKPVEINQPAANYFYHPSAIIDQNVQIGEGSKIWHFSHLLSGVQIGHQCSIGQNVMIGPDVIVGNRCKIQNNVSLYKGVRLDDDVFCGPSCVFTNVKNPRAHINRQAEFLTTHVQKNVTIGANATLVCGITLGQYSLIGAGAVVTKNAPPHALMAGNPAKQIGWVSHAGESLKKDLICPKEGRRYQIKNNQLIEITA